MENEKYSYGYPKYCNTCMGFDSSLTLKVEPHYKSGSSVKVMLIGQDPTIFNDPHKSRVKEVLMLDDNNGQLRKWLKNLFGKENFEKVEIYATNLVKCTFDAPPSMKGKSNFLEPYFQNCQSHLIAEIKNYKPAVVFTFGEPAHHYFRTLLPMPNNIEKKMNEAFGKQFYKIHFDDFSFNYSPCLHIKTFRVAETYGKKIEVFKTNVQRFFSDYDMVEI